MGLLDKIKTENTADRYLPFIRHSDAHTIITRNRGAFQMLKLEGVDAKYDSFKALDGISMSVEPGELVVLLGANGAGKTTLFNTVSGLMKPAAGRITIDGKDVTGRKPSALVAAGVVQCPEGRKLFPSMSVLKNLRLGGYVHRRDRAGRPQYPMRMGRSRGSARSSCCR